MNNNKIFSNLSDILKKLIDKLINHFKSDDNPVIRKYVYPDDDVIVKNPIPRKFGNFYFLGFENSGNHDNDENLAYEESLFKNFQKILYYVNNSIFFNKYIMKSEEGSEEYFSLFSLNLPPKISNLLTRNMFHYCFRYPRRFFEHGTNCFKKYIAEPLFWVDDISQKEEQQNDTHHTAENEARLKFITEGEEEEEDDGINLDQRLKEEELIVKDETEEQRNPSDKLESEPNQPETVNNLLIDLKERFSLKYTNKYSNISSIMKHLIMTQVNIFNNLTTKNINDVQFRESFYMRFFYNSVVYPSMIYIYKTILVTKNLSIMQKYEVYEIILNLLNSFSVFLIEITNPEIFNLEKIFEINKKRKFFTFEGETSNHMIEQSNKINKIVKNMEENNDPMKIRDNIKVLEENFGYFRILEDKVVINTKNIFTDFVDIYEIKKQNYSNNVIKALLSLNDVKAASYKQNTYFMFIKNILMKKYVDENGVKIESEKGKDEKINFRRGSDESMNDNANQNNEFRRDKPKRNTVGMSKKDMVQLELESPYIPTEQDELNKLDMNNVDSMSHLRFVLINMTKIILIDPVTFQLNILRDDTVDLCRNLIGGKMIPKVRKFFPTHILKDFFLWDQPNSYTGPYGTLLDIVEFLRVLCEGHNQAFQVFMETIDMFDDDGSSVKLNDFLFKINMDIIELLEHYLDRQDTIGFMEKRPQVDFFYKLYSNITNFFIEIIQGSFSYVYLTTFIPIPNSAFYDYHIRHMLLLENLPRSLKYSAYVSCFLKLVDNILQEKVTTSNDTIKKILDVMNSKQKEKGDGEGEFSKVDAFPHLYIVRSLNYFNLYQNAKFCIHKVYCKIKDIPISSIKTVPHLELLELFKTNDDFCNDILFSIATSIFMILKNLSMKNIYDRKKAYSFVKGLQDNPDEEYLFFSTIIRTVELNYTVPENLGSIRTLREKIIKQDPDEKDLFENILFFKRTKCDFFAVEIFLIDPLSLKLEENDIDIVVKTTDVTNLHEKQVHLLNKIPRIIEVINTRKDIDSWNPLIRVIATLNYTQDKMVTLVSNWVSVCFMLIVNITLMLTLRQEDYMSGGDYESMVFAFNAIHLTGNFLLIMNLLLIDGFYEIRIDKAEALTSKFPIYYNFVICIIATLDPQLYFLFSFGLFSMVPLIDVMRIVTVALYNRTIQFLSAGAFLLFFIIIFAAFGFFFLREDMVSADGSIVYCVTYFSCFIETFTYGLRDLGVQDQPYILSYYNEFYWKRFIFDWLFFFFTLFILINIFNGIVVDTFQSYREENEKIQDHLQNVCYICHLSRNDLAIKSLDFDVHITEEHSVRDYINFLIKIKSIDENDLNNLGTQALKLMEEGEPSMFPMKTSMSYDKKKLL